MCYTVTRKSSEFELIPFTKDGLILYFPFSCGGISKVEKQPLIVMILIYYIYEEENVLYINLCFSIKDYFPVRDRCAWSF